MTAENFVYWLQGFFELDGADEMKRQGLTTEQVEMIKEHLGYVFGKKPTVKPAKVEQPQTGSHQTAPVPTPEKIQEAMELLEEMMKKPSHRFPLGLTSGDSIVTC